jgi:hypothetical protein
VMGNCKDCKHWSARKRRRILHWYIGLGRSRVGGNRRRMSLLRDDLGRCENRLFQAMVGSLDLNGRESAVSYGPDRPATAPDFGCVLFEAKEIK